MPQDFRNSMAFAGGNIVFVVIAGVLGFRWIRKQYPEVYAQMAKVHSRLLVSVRDPLWGGTLHST